MAHIRLRDIRKSFGDDEILHGIDLEICDGEFVVILGPSGCGKSTLLRMIAGLEGITSGEIAIDGVVVDGVEPQDRGCAMVFQNYALYPHMTVAENIGYALRVAGVPRRERRARVEPAARMVGLDALLDRKPGQLSGGQRQRVAMARAMIREPRVFLFDEPLSNLDATLRVQMRHEVRRIHDRIGATSIFVTHDQQEGMTLADRIVVMNRGTIEQVGAPSEIYRAPATAYVAGFVGSPAMRFLPARIDVNRNAAVLEGGDVIRLPRGVGAGRDGTLVQVGLRPEALALVGPDGPGIPGRYDFVEDLGPQRLYHVTYEGLALSILSTQTRRLAPGDPVRIGIPPDAVHLFDGASGARLGSPAVAEDRMTASA